MTRMATLFAECFVIVFTFFCLLESDVTFGAKFKRDGWLTKRKQNKRYLLVTFY